MGFEEATDPLLVDDWLAAVDPAAETPAPEELALDAGTEAAGFDEADLELGDAEMAGADPAPAALELAGATEGVDVADPQATSKRPHATAPIRLILLMNAEARISSPLLPANNPG